MKSGTDTKVKFKRLQRRLSLRRWQCVGVLETLWQTTLREAYLGDIGRLSDEDIAAALEWDGDAESLVQALVDTEWLDRDEKVRLVVHDWSQHCPNHIKGAAEKHGGIFADVAAKERAKQHAKEGAIAEHKASCQAPLPNQTKPNQTKPDQTSLSPLANGDEQKRETKRIRFEPEDMEVAVWMFEQIKSQLPNHKEPNFGNWANDIRLMREIDGEDRSHDGIRSLFTWVQDDQFWRANVLSPNKLREKWDQLQAKRSSRYGSTASRVGPGQRYQG